MKNSQLSFGNWFFLFTLMLGLYYHSDAQENAKVNMKHWMAPASSDAIKNPEGDNAATVEEGKKSFQINCVVCHGALGNGDGPAAAALGRHPGILSDAKMMWNQTDGNLFWKLTEGNSPMPTFRTSLTEKQRWQLVSYIRTLAPKPANIKSETASPTSSSSTEKKEAQENESSQNKSVSDEKIAEIEGSIRELQNKAKENQSGTTHFLVGGYGTASFHAPREKSAGFKNSFGAAFNPLLLWKINDQILFEGEVEYQLEGTETTVNLEVAQVSYLLADGVTFGAGRFLNPMNFFVERQHMGWVNKMPDKPLTVYDGLLAESLLGMQLRGLIPIGSVKVEYSVFVANPPTLNTTDSLNYGTVEFDDLSNSNNHMSVGGRIGVLPFSELELGYGIHTSAVGPAGTDANVVMQSVDVNYVHDSPKLIGLFNFRGQWVWQKVSDVTYDANSALGFGPKVLNDSRDGGYAQLSYRPQYLKQAVLKNFEAILRFDILNQKKTTVGYDEWRYAIGLDYWIYSNVVIKAAYELDQKNGSGKNGDAIHAEFITGF